MDVVSRYLAEVAGLTLPGPRPSLTGQQWASLPQQAQAERLLPQVQAALERSPQAPSDCRRAVHELVAESTIRNLLVKHQLGRITAALQAAGIDLCPLKGVALAQRLHGEPTARQCGDIDVLIRPPDRDRTVAVLADLGFRPESSFDEELDHHTLLKGHVGGHTVWIELHTGIKFNNRPFFPQTWWEARVPLALGNQTVPFFRDDHLLVYLCMHAANHGYSALGWLADIAALIRCGSFTWEQVILAAREAHLSRPVYYTLALLRQLGVSEVDEAALAAIRPPRNRFWLARLLFLRPRRPARRISRLVAAAVSAEPARGVSHEWLLPSYHAFTHAHPKLAPGAARLLYLPWLVRGMLRVALALLRSGLPVRKT